MKPEAMRKLASGMQRRIDHARRPMTQNSTPKRQKEYGSRLHDAENLERVQRALLVLADSQEFGTLPPELVINTLKEISPLVYKGLLSGGYYDVKPDPQYRDKSLAGVQLQAMVDAYVQPGDAERERANRLRQLEDKVRFSPIEGFFPTPPAVCGRMRDLLGAALGMRVLEPSAGKGDLAEAVRGLGIDVRCIEINFTLRGILEAKGFDVVGCDFVEWVATQKLWPTLNYDRIVMNPPFERGQDAEHVMLAYAVLAAGGRLVSIVSDGPFFREDSRSQDFRQWLEALGAETLSMDDGSFAGKDSFRRTGIKSRIIVVNKR